MAGEEGTELVRRFVEEVWNQGNTQVVEEIFDPTMVEHSELGLERFGEDQGAVIGLYGSIVTPIDVPGREGLRRRILAFRNAFPDGRMTIDDIRSDGDTVTWSWTYTGTQSGQFREVQASNKQVTVKGTTRERIDGKVQERWVEADLSDMQTKLGTKAVPGTA
jgi:predicted ester cyclase